MCNTIIEQIMIECMEFGFIREMNASKERIPIAT